MQVVEFAKLSICKPYKHF